MVEVGETTTEIVGAVPLNVVPSDKVPDMVPGPVTANDKVAELPLQIVCEPLRVAVGLGFTLTVALPVKDTPMQFASCKVDIV